MGLVLHQPGDSDADAMRRRAAAWAQGAADSRAADRDRWRAMTMPERVEEASELVRRAEQWRAGDGPARA